MSRCAANTFGLAEIEALLRLAAAADRRDVDGAQRAARSSAAINVRRKLQRMRDRILSAPERPAAKPVIEVAEPEPEVVPPPRQYVSRRKLELRARREGGARVSARRSS